MFPTFTQQRNYKGTPQSYTLSHATWDVVSDPIAVFVHREKPAAEYREFDIYSGRFRTEPPKGFSFLDVTAHELRQQWERYRAVLAML